jgi:hypothetical protein
MASPTLTAIEKQIDQLSRKEQLWLIEHLASRLRKNALAERAAWEVDLAAMAADSEIQKQVMR